MTYGEAHEAEGRSIVLENGKWVKTLYIPNKAEPMKHDDAVKYYNKKLFDYWLTKLDDRLSTCRKSQLLSALMYGHVDNYKKYEEKI